MAENYSLNSKFGFNVIPKGDNSSSAQQESVKEEKSSSDLFEYSNNFFSKFEEVSSGKVEHQINMYSRQAMIIGMNLRAAEPKRNFDVNI